MQKTSTSIELNNPISVYEFRTFKNDLNSCTTFIQTFHYPTTLLLLEVSHLQHRE